VRLHLSAFLGRGSQQPTGRAASYHATLLRDAGDAAALKIGHLTLAPNDSLFVDPHSGGGFVARLEK